MTRPADPPLFDLLAPRRLTTPSAAPVAPGPSLLAPGTTAPVPQQPVVAPIPAVPVVAPTPELPVRSEVVGNVAAAPAFHVNLFALVHQRGSVLLVQPRQPLLPGNLSVPGMVMRGDTGEGVADHGLRRELLRQVGLSVGELKLVGSFSGPVADDGRVDRRLYLVFGAEYCSGLLTPNPDDLVSAQWVPVKELESRGVSAWLRDAARTLLAGPPGGGDRARRGFFRSA